MMQSSQNYMQHWDDKFKARGWGRYPPEDLVRFMARNYTGIDHAKVSVLEIGCGPGANLWFLHREGYKVSGIDGSPVAIHDATARLDRENKAINTAAADLQLGNFSKLPWPESQFDLVLDIFALYANALDVIHKSVAEIDRVLKPGGFVYAKFWGRNTTGCGEGKEIEPGTYDEIPAGPCQDMGISHFFDRQEIVQLFNGFEVVAIDVINRTDVARSWTIEEYHCHFKKAEK